MGTPGLKGKGPDISPEVVIALPIGPAPWAATTATGARMPVFRTSRRVKGFIGSPDSVRTDRIGSKFIVQMSAEVCAMAVYAPFRGVPQLSAGTHTAFPEVVDSRVYESRRAQACDG